MATEKNNAITENLARRYVNEYYSLKIHIFEKEQPHFWDAVVKLCCNPEADISSLIIDRNKYCIDEGFQRKAYFTNADKTAKSVSDLAKNIANEILEHEAQDISKLDFLIMKEEIKNIKKRIDFLTPNIECF